MVSQVNLVQAAARHANPAVTLQWFEQWFRSHCIPLSTGLVRLFIFKSQCCPYARRFCPTPWRDSPPYLLSWTSWMFSMPMALLRRELKGPDFFLVGLFPGMISDWRRRAEEKPFKYTVWGWSRSKWFSTTLNAVWGMCNLMWTVVWIVQEFSVVKCFFLTLILHPPTQPSIHQHSAPFSHTGLAGSVSEL